MVPMPIQTIQNNYRSKRSTAGTHPKHLAVQKQAFAEMEKQIVCYHLGLADAQKQFVQAAIDAIQDEIKKLYDMDLFEYVKRSNGNPIIRSSSFFYSKIRRARKFNQT